LVNIPYLRNNISISLALSAALALVLLTSPLLPLSNPLLQPVQAQTTMTFKTPKPADGTTGDTDIAATLTFDVHGTTTPGSIILKVNNGTFQITSKENGKILQSGSIGRGSFTNLSSGAKLGLESIIGDPANPLIIDTHCSTSATNGIGVRILGGAPVGGFSGVVECSPQGGNTPTTNQQQPSSSSSLTGSSQGTDGGSSSNSTESSSNSKDGDSDGIPDSSDRCPNNSQHRCFKEGDTSTTTTTTHEQQPSSPSSSSSNRTGNQTR
jgi:hypothetical protein